MFKISLLICTLFTLILSAPQRSLDEAPAPYNFQYNVDNPPTNTFFGQNESADSSGRVTGSYYVYLPDGRLMTVDYSVDDQTGFVPKITFQQNANPGQG